MVYNTETDSESKIPLLSVRRLQPALGAEIGGVDLRRPLTRELRDAIYSALVRHRVIFFRDQNINREQHIAFARAFGELEVHEHYPHPEGFPSIVEFKVLGKSKYAPDIWHIDNGCLPNPPCISVLRSHVLPPIGGDTVFANAVIAYEGLDERTKADIERLKAVQMVDHSRKAKEVDPNVLAMRRAWAPPVVYPVVRIHPDTGERVLFVNDCYTDHIVGFDRRRSDALLAHLTDQVKRPEYQLRFQWSPHTLAMWDNRSVQHYAVTDYDEPRHLERVTVIGDAPAGPSEGSRPHPLPDINNCLDS
jgi:alpha-ketoglutarate-dependent taurine dioxygenase